MEWNGDDVLKEYDKCKNVCCNCCLLSTVTTLFFTGVFLKMFFAGYL